MGRAVRGGWVGAYEAEREGVVLARVHWCVALTAVGVTLVGVAVAATAADPAPHLVAMAALGAVCALAGGVTVLGVARRQARALALAYVVGLTAAMAATFHFLPEDVEGAAAAYVALMLGTTLLLPWGAGPQAASAVVALGGYAWNVAGASTLPSLAALCVVASAFPVAVAGARLIDRYRATSFAHAWRQVQLVSLARELAEHVEPGEVIATVLERGLRLVDADSAAVSLHDPSRRVYRVEAMAGAGVERAEWMIGLEAPEDYPPAPRIVAAGTLQLPEEDPESPIVRLLAEHGGRRLLYVAMRHGGNVVGIMNLMRRDDRPFDEADRLLARSLADQAAVALHTARLVADLRRASRLKSEFVSTMSHELRTPLNVILGFTEMARDAGGDRAAQEECLGRIEAAGRDLLALIEGTLEVGKLEAGREDVELQPLALPAYWAELGRGCARMPCRAGVVLDWQEAVPAVEVVTDRRKLALIVRNLVGNALKFTEHGRVEVAAALGDDALEVSVADTGIGIRPEDQETIFEMFRQADGSDSRRYGGTGLGLYLVRRFVEQLGGTVAVDSAPDRGSTFTVRVPTGGAVRPVGPATRAA
jgi:signal transduction histidine kinase